MSRALLLCAALAVLTSPALAELPPLSKEQLEQQASHIVHGRVVEVYTAQRQKDSPEFVDTLYAIELAVDGVDKGEGIKDGQQIFIRTWKASRRPRGWAGPGGQSQIPRRNQNVTVYLVNKDGGYDVLIPNGLVIQKTTSGSKDGTGQ